MDVSKEYILMCEKAVEIQGLNQLEDGDWFYDGKSVFVRTHWRGYLPKVMLWLPRQDQLQKMVYKNEGLQTICTQIEQFSKSEYGSGFTINGTMEQLWLAFVMLKLYNKKWNDKEWV